jgi:hypothetical protein
MRKRAGERFAGRFSIRERGQEAFASPFGDAELKAQLERCGDDPSGPARRGGGAP